MKLDNATAATLQIRRVDHLTERERDDLTEVLIACVDGGASLGFHAPLAPERARAWWDGFPRPGVVLLVAERDGQVVARVQQVEDTIGQHHALAQRAQLCADRKSVV